MDNLRLMTLGTFMRGVLLGELGMNNLPGDSFLNSLFRQVTFGVIGWAEQDIQLAIHRVNIIIPEKDTGWSSILTEMESGITAGYAVSDLIYRLAYEQIYELLTSTDPNVYRTAVLMFDVFTQHAIYFEQGLRLNTQSIHKH